MDLSLHSYELARDNVVEHELSACGEVRLKCVENEQRGGDDEVYAASIGPAAIPVTIRGMALSPTKPLIAAFLLLHAWGPQDVVVVERGRVGAVALGMGADSLYGQFRDRAKLVDLKLEGHLSPALEIKLFEAQLKPSIIAEIGPVDSRLVVTRIHVVDPRLRTKEGIGVGSTYEELRSRYPVDWVGAGEGALFARVEALGISIQLDASRHPGLWRIRDPNAVPKDVRLVGIMLTR